MANLTRRELLASGGAFILLADESSGQSNVPAGTSPDHGKSEAVWREPGQILSADYRKSGALRYEAANREIIGRNRSCFNNRPLYCDPGTQGVVLAGDRPFVRLLFQSCVMGGFCAGLVRNGVGKWFHDYSNVESRYRCGRMSWQLSDSSLIHGFLTLDVVPLLQAAGFALRFRAKGLLPGEKLVWTFGGASNDGNVRSQWDPIMHGNPNLYRSGNPRKPQMDLGIDAPRCKGNQVSINSEQFLLSPDGRSHETVVGMCNRPGGLFVADAATCGAPNTIGPLGGSNLPIACGLVDLTHDKDELFWVIRAQSADLPQRALVRSTAAATFNHSCDYLKSIERVKISTPDSRLDAAMAAVCHPIDAGCDRHPFIFRHGCMSFWIPFVGWRVISGATALGWHDRVKGAAAYYSQFQVKDDLQRTRSQPDASKRLCIEGAQSRFYGRGRINRDTHMYDTQSQFFDQLVREWRWTGDTELEKTLRPMLELHLEWAADCFDPDGDGLYESYINTLPTDSVWYNGGGSVEESSYIHYGHLAAADMALRARDAAAELSHRRKASRIKQAVNELLWLKNRGHFGLYLEQGGHRRVHSDAWVYSQFLPIDTGITNPVQALEALYYTEWGLERIGLPFGGELCQSSNWVPYKWSVRDVFGGDLCALALAYLQTGLPDQGWELLLGATLESAYASSVPGGFSHIGAGTDFGDCSHMFARTVVEGLFGYCPDLPNGVLRMRPAFPSAWSEASIATPDFQLSFYRSASTDVYRLQVAKKLDVEFCLAVRAEKVVKVTLGGQPIPWVAEPGFGCTWIRFVAKNFLLSHDIVVEVLGRLSAEVPSKVEGHVGEKIVLEAAEGSLIAWHDLHQVVEGSSTATARTLEGRCVDKPGHHILLAEVKRGDLPQYQIFKLHLLAAKDSKQTSLTRYLPVPVNAGWELVNLEAGFNGDVRTIFEQRYVTPRPASCSVRLGVDGYSAWTFAFWGDKPPKPDFNNLEKLKSGIQQFRTPQNVPFRSFPPTRNIAFTSLWDNWPNSVSVPIHRKADAVWLLLAGTTFPMQTRIANAEVRFRYSDNVVETLELVPPFNFWSLCPWGGGDYDYETDAFCLPKEPPPTVQLGRNCRAMVLSWKLRPESTLAEVTLETLSQDVVIGLMGLSLIEARE